MGVNLKTYQRAQLRTLFLPKTVTKSWESIKKDEFDARITGHKEQPMGYLLGCFQ